GGGGGGRAGGNRRGGRRRLPSGRARSPGRPIPAWTGPPRGPRRRGRRGCVFWTCQWLLRWLWARRGLARECGGGTGPGTAHGAAAPQRASSPPEACSPQLQRDGLPFARRPVGGQYDAQAVHRVGQVLGEVQVVADRAQQVLLFAQAEPVVIGPVVVGLVGGVDPLVGARELAACIPFLPVDAQRVGRRVRVD